MANHLALYGGEVPKISANANLKWPSTFKKLWIDEKRIYRISGKARYNGIKSFHQNFPTIATIITDEIKILLICSYKIIIITKK